MALKRKRSSPGFSSPASDTTSSTSTDSNNGSLPFFYAQSKPVEPLYHKPTWAFPTYDDGEKHYRSMADMNSRTRKRHRDDRPEEGTVYCRDNLADWTRGDTGLTWVHQRILSPVSSTRNDSILTPSLCHLTILHP